MVGYDDFGRLEFIKAMKNIGIGNIAGYLDMIPGETINYLGGELNAFIYYINECFDDDIKRDNVNLSKLLALNDKVKYKLKEAVDEGYHVNPFDWIVDYIIDKFTPKGNIILHKDIDFSKNVEIKTSVHRSYTRESYNVLFVKKDSNYDFKTLVNNFDIEESGKDEKLWFHGTTFASCENIIACGIQPPYRTYGHDFGTGDAFYVGEDLKNTFEFNKMRKRFMNHQNPFAIIIFRTKSLSDIDGSDKRNGTYKVSYLSDEKWSKVVKYSLEKKSRELHKFYPEVDESDFAYGPISETDYDRETKLYGNIRQNGHYQLALKSKDAYQLFNQSIKGILVFSESL